MEPFTISCTTCQKRLKVRDASAIGQILICPGCGSMVLVEAPPPASGPLAASAGPLSAAQMARPSESSTTGIAADSGNVPQARTPAPAPSESAPPPDLGVSGAAALKAATPVPPASDTAGPGPDGPGSPTTPAPAAVPAAGAPGNVWEIMAGAEPAQLARPEASDTAPLQSQLTASQTSWWATSAAAVGGVLLALSVFGILASRSAHSTPPSTAAHAPPAAVPAVAAPEATAPVPPAPAPARKAANDHPVPATTAPEPVAVPPSSPVVAKPPAEKPAPPETAPAVPETPEVMIADQEAAAKETRPDVAALSQSFGSFAPFIDAASVTPPPAAGESPAATLPTPESLDNGPAEVSPSRPTLRTIDVPQRLRDPIAEIEFANTPLIDFVQFVTGLSTIPISLDPDALALVKATPLSPVSIRQSKTNVGQMLATALTPLRLGYVAADGHLRVTRPPSPQGALRSHTHSVADIVGTEPKELGLLTDLIATMVEPDAWAQDGGRGTVLGQMPALIFQQRDTVLFQALLFCDKLRVARGLPPQSTLNPQLFQLEPRLARARKMLATPITLNCLQPTLLTRLLDQVRKEKGVAILVDWAAVAELGWTPDAEVKISASQLPLADFLDQLLRPMDLTYRVLDATTLQITTPAVLAHHHDVEFYAVGDLLSEQLPPDQLLERLRQALGDPEPAVPGQGPVLHWDPPSQYLLVSASQPQHRRVAELLTQWRTERAAGQVKSP